MTLTTEVRIDWPVPAIRLLDHVTAVAGGDPATVARHVEDGHVWNRAGQGLRTLAGVRFSERPDYGYDDGEYRSPAPRALVILTLDNPYGYGVENTGRYVQANEILPAVVEWLDDHGVPRDRWWWEDETAGTYHPGTTSVRYLNTDDLREVWEPTTKPTSPPRTSPPSDG
jgi:hypothetical protein